MACDARPVGPHRTHVVPATTLALAAFQCRLTHYLSPLPRVVRPFPSNSLEGLLFSLSAALAVTFSFFIVP
jgi:hypothetical protein